MEAFMKLGIRGKLTGLILGIIILLLVGVFVTVFFTYKAALDESLKTEAFDKNELIALQIDDWFAPHVAVVNEAAIGAKYVEGNERAILPLLKKLNSENNESSTVFWASEAPYYRGGFFYDATGWVPEQDYDQTTRDWFKFAKAQNKTIITEPYLDGITGKLVISAATPAVTFDGSPIGIMGADIYLTTMADIVNSTKLSQHGASYMLTSEGFYIIHTDEKKILKESLFNESMMRGLEKTILNSDKSFGYFYNNKYYYSSVRMKSTDWVFVTFGPLADIYAPLRSFAGILVLIAIIGLIIAIVATVFIARSMTTPLLLACAKADEIASGELRNDVPEKMKTRKDEFGQLGNAFQDMIGHLRSVLVGIRDASSQVDSGAQQMSTTSQQLSQGATEQAASVEQVSASMEEMAANIRQNADNSQQTEKIALAAVQSVTAGGEAVEKTVEAMKEIASKISIIEEIARSTNMLSLNASIEAARAGEYGKGFAVVAAEVGKLAERSQKEAGEISKLSKESVLIAEEAGTTIASVIPDIKRTAELVQEISAASNEQTIGTDQINSAIMQLDQVVQQNASYSEESASMSEELAGQSQQMLNLIGYFKITENQKHIGNTKPIVNIQEKKKIQEIKPVKQIAVKTQGQAVSNKQSDESKTAMPAVKKIDSPKETQKVEGINIILDEDSSYRGRDSLDNEYQEF